MKKVFIAKYGELWLKSKPVKNEFIRKLVYNIKTMLKNKKINSKVERFRDMLVIESEDSKVADVLSKTFGISWFTLATEVKPDFKSMEKAVLKIAKEIKPEQTFAVRASRNDKTLPFTSMQIENEMGKLVDRKVNLSDPDFTIFIEVRKNNAYIFSEKIRGPGGLPYGVSGRVLSLMSGGIDSPVSSWLMMKRGCDVGFVYFYPDLFTDSKTLKRVEEIVEKIGEYTPNGVKFYVVPFSEIQKSLVEKCEIKLTCVLCRRSMYRTAQALSDRVKAKALVTGENLAQVASQTLDNLFTESEVLKMPIFRPLIGMDKEDIILIAKKIGTYKLSIGIGCCTLSPKKPATKSKVDNILNEEKNIKNLDKLIEKSIEKSEM